MLEECQTITEQSYIYNYIYMFDTFLTLIDILANNKWWKGENKKKFYFWISLWRVITENKFIVFDYIYIVHCEQHKDTNIYKVGRVQ